MGGPADIDGECHRECDNFHQSPFVVNGITYANAEHYFQWAKCVLEEDKERILKVTEAVEAWAIGNNVRLRPDWEKVKVRVMYVGNKARFEQHPELLAPLVSTHGKVVFTGSTSFWLGRQHIHTRTHTRTHTHAHTDSIVLASIYIDISKTFRLSVPSLPTADRRNKWNGKIMELIRAEARRGPGDAEHATALWQEIEAYEALNAGKGVRRWVPRDD
eukprot:m.36971 g.36971  ORF g.36971 m.36971 type:complete len:217 (+) comp5420_c0_seq2:72-722(+)